MSALGSNAQRELVEGVDAVAETAGVDVSAFHDALRDADRVTLVGCGSSFWTAAMTASVFREHGHDADAVYASEFFLTEYRVPDLVVGFSQSGETTETVRALERAADEGATVGAVVNTGGSTMTELADVAVVTPAGDENAVLATKSVDAALAVAYRLVDGPDLAAVAERCRRALDVDVTGLVDRFVEAERAYALGVGGGYGLAGEAATKLGEGPLVQTTPLPALEMNHGYISNAAGVPTALFVTDDVDATVYREVVDDLRERGAIPLVVAPPGEDYGAPTRVTLSDAPETLLPALKVVQRLAVESAIERGYDPDSPPGLSKHVERDDI